MEENRNSINENPQQSNSAPKQPGSAPQRPKAAGAKRPAPKKEDKEKKSSGIGTVIMIILIVGLIGGLGFMVFRDQEKSKVILAKQKSIDTLSLTVKNQIAELEAMEAELLDWQTRASDLQLNVDSLQGLIVDINSLKEQLKTAKGNAWYFQKQMKAFRAKADAIGLEVDSLKRANELALLKIDTLNQEKALMVDTLSRIKQEKTELTEKVELASIMKGEEFSIAGYNHKGKEYIRDVYKSKHLDKLKLQFYLSENKVAPKNDKQLIMRLIEPDGTVLFSGTDGGSFDTAEGEEKMFTMSQSVSFDGAKQKVGFTYQKGNDYKSGKHTIEVYADGHKIGETSFNVK